MNNTTTVLVNGKAFSVVGGSVAGGVMELAGKRGGTHSLVRNVNSGRWIFLRGGMREEAVTSLEVR